MVTAIDGVNHVVHILKTVPQQLPTNCSLSFIPSSFALTRKEKNDENAKSCWAVAIIQFDRMVTSSKCENAQYYI